MSITLNRVASRVYFVGNTFPVKDQIKKLGGHWDSDRKQWWVGATKADDAAKLVADLTASAPADTAGSRPTGLPTMSEPDDRRVIAKVDYKGSNWYMIAQSHTQNRCLVCKLTGTAIWVDMADCNVVKSYPPREYRGRQEYTTLGSIRRFVDRQRRMETTGAPQCAACGKRSSRLHHDLEDGLMKCHDCCDIPE